MNIGDTVMLKSGGPIMTIDNLSAITNDAKCQWFDGNNLLDGWFNLKGLILATVPVTKKK